jgi:hypothetical protein
MVIMTGHMKWSLIMYKLYINVNLKQHKTSFTQSKFSHDLRQTKDRSQYYLESKKKRCTAIHLKTLSAVACCLCDKSQNNLQNAILCWFSQLSCELWLRLSTSGSDPPPSVTKLCVSSLSSSTPLAWGASRCDCCERHSSLEVFWFQALL